MQHKKLLYVVPKGEMIREKRAQLGEQWEVISLGVKVCGAGYDEIWIDEDYQMVYDEMHLIKAAEENIRDLYVRLNAGGRLRYVQ